jgi:pSer/pThr/pTyr-binding forkhead associated (FHA) protein
VSLYVFLAWAFFSVWRDSHQQGVVLAKRRIPRLVLTIRSSEETPQRRFFIQGEITIGRDPACECPVDDDSISARHARLSYHHHQWWLEDLGSTNGTLLNQVRVQIPTVIISGDEFVCGETHFGVGVADQEPSADQMIRNREREIPDEPETNSSRF